MEAPGTGFLPLFRSDQQHTLLCFLFVLMPQGKMTMSQLAAATGISASTISREVARLETCGVVTVETIGRSNLVGPNWASPLGKPLRMMLAHTCGPLWELGVLRDVPGVDVVFVFGSWAERYQGFPGPYPNDIDVLVVADDSVDSLVVQTICSRAARDLQKYAGGTLLDINPVVITAQQWVDPQSAFLERVKAGAIVEVTRQPSQLSAAPMLIPAGQR
jgi:DNA-binding Lrp family transcriptional regulator